MDLCAFEVSYTYPDGTKAIDEVSLCIYSGEIACLLGPNGSGKSTLLLLLAGLIRPTSGYITFKGVKLEYIADYRRLCGVLFQDPSDQLIAPTVEEDVALGPKQLKLSDEDVRVRVKSSLERFGLLGFERRSPFRLSGGETARVALAGLIASDPQVYLLDEPSSSLDVRGINVLKGLLRELKKKGKLVIIATQDSDFASEVADKIYIMSRGKLIAGGGLEVMKQLNFEEIGIKMPSALRIYKKLSIPLNDPPVNLDSLVEALRRLLSTPERD
ncbi:MAG: energy-coupling factor ABC transporter ATP-binding protein [Candidatus Korarchaeum sp.]|nr:energy-coupling factor ABC transporter ATP-binding protein [Candidatus Korarchaeum sp.]MDW8035476.1 ABC transporter ATP-binding protein [Candidatus Korarchaeum sp.]